MSTATELLPLIAAVSSASAGLGAAVTALFKGRAQAKTAALTAHARETAAQQETERSEHARDVALAPTLMQRITALEAHVTRLDAAVAECANEKHGLARELTEAIARATLAEREVTLQSARADLAEMDAHDLRSELARWRDQSDAAD